MTWAIPNWWAVVLLGLAALRCFQLLANDVIFDRPRNVFLRRIPKGEEWLTCPWCAGFWITLAWWLAWIWQPKWALIVATPFAISALVGLLGRLLPD